MQVEIEVVGKPNKWVVNEPIIRIGRGTKCDISLPARQFPNVNILHAELEAFDGTLRLIPRDGSPTQLLLNGDPAQNGDVVLSGDVLSLGPDGPELRIIYVPGAEASAGAGYVPTRVISVDEIPGRDATRMMNAPAQTVQAPAPSRAPRSTTPEPQRPIAQPISAAPGPLDRFAEQRDRWPATSKPAVTSVPVRAPPAAPVTGPAAPHSAPSSAMVDPALLNRLRNLQIMQGVTLALLVLLAIWVFQLRGDVATSHDEIRALRAQDQNAVGQLTPSLDARLNVFGQRMDAMDAMFKGSQERMERGMDAKVKEAEDQIDARMKATEDRMLSRMNTELPPMLDKYINAKMSEIKH